MLPKRGDLIFNDRAVTAFRSDDLNSTNVWVPAGTFAIVVEVHDCPADLPRFALAIFPTAGRANQTRMHIQIEFWRRADEWKGCNLRLSDDMI